MSSDAFNKDGGAIGGIRSDIQGFERFLGPINQRFLDASFGRVDPSQTQQRLGAVGDRLFDVGTGGIDPRFQQAAQAQRAVLGGQRDQALNARRQQLSRAGIDPASTVAANEFANINQPFNLQERALTSDLALQGMQRGDQALLNAANVAGQGFQTQLAGQQFNNQALGSELAAARAGIENRQLPIAQQIGLVAAQNAGEGGGGGGGGKGKGGK